MQIALFLFFSSPDFLPLKKRFIFHQISQFQKKSNCALFLAKTLDHLISAKTDELKRFWSLKKNPISESKKNPPFFCQDMSLSDRKKTALFFSISVEMCRRTKNTANIRNE